MIPSFCEDISEVLRLLFLDGCNEALAEFCGGIQFFHIQKHDEAVVAWLVLQPQHHAGFSHSAWDKDENMLLAERVPKIVDERLAKEEICFARGAACRKILDFSHLRTP